MQYEFAWIVPAVAVIGGLTYVILTSYWKSHRTSADPATAKALEENSAINKALLEKLTSIDDRLTAVEKTLNDIPN
jgi:hypothetical protein